MVISHVLFKCVTWLQLQCKGNNSTILVSNPHHHFNQALSVCLLFLVKCLVLAWQMVDYAWQVFNANPDVLFLKVKRQPNQEMIRHSWYACPVKEIDCSRRQLYSQSNVCNNCYFLWDHFHLNHLTRSNKQTVSTWWKWWCRQVV